QLVVQQTSGNVGIGTTSPMSALAVVGNINVTGCAKAATSTGANAEFNACVDLAETYPVRENAEPGDIMMVGSAGDLVKAVFSSASSSIPVIGIISSDPGIVLEGHMAAFGGSNFNASSEYPSGSRAPLALAGRVPVKVSLVNGPINAGDRITVSSVAGVGVKATTSGMTVGIALEAYTQEIASASPRNDGVGKIFVFVNLGYAKLDEAISAGNGAYTGNIGTETYWSVDQSTGKLGLNFLGDLDLKGNSITNIKALTSALGKWSMDEHGTLMAVKVITDELIAQKITVGSAVAPSGITLYDEITKEPYCVKIVSGAVVPQVGACGAAGMSNVQTPMTNEIPSSNDQIATTTAITSESTASTTPITTATSATDTASTTAPVSDETATTTVSLAQ
ncbi:MAG: hypothetical protein AAB915_00305, partial [Patescibacteria group bacterium]